MIFKKSADRFVLKLLSSKSYPGLMHKCPQCGGQIQLRFYEAREKWVSVQANCDTCSFAMAVDGIKPVPTWIEEAIQDNPSL